MFDGCNGLLVTKLINSKILRNIVERALVTLLAQVVGMLKVGRKKLFLLDAAGKPHELSPMCVLDFYVTETRQRTGCGKRLFEAMLRREQVEPRSLAVDRPSEKLISFLRKHYSLASIIPQVSCSHLVSSRSKSSE